MKDGIEIYISTLVSLHQIVKTAKRRIGKLCFFWASRNAACTVRTCVPVLLATYDVLCVKEYRCVVRIFSHDRRFRTKQYQSDWPGERSKSSQYRLPLIFSGDVQRQGSQRYSFHPHPNSLTDMTLIYAHHVRKQGS